MTADRPAEQVVQREKPRRLALDDPAALAWSARLIQAALERRRARLAAEGKRKGKGGEHDAA